jgi:septation ring formation regulator EzrA
MTQKPEQKQINAIDPKDVAKTINTIVSLMESIDASREMVNDRIKYLKTTYGLASSDVRAAATALKNQNIDELDEKTKRIQELVDLCL